VSAPLPLEQLPVDFQRRIAEAVASPTPPSRWVNVGHAQIPSRAWYEWHRARRLNPNRRSSLSPGVRQAVIARDGLTCGLCGDPVELADVHIDHIIPVARGGDDWPGNLQVTHSACNVRKGVS
jgi:5-methylcytosine-specific restriction endonuclease McrA